MPQTRHQDATNCQQPNGAAVGISELLHGAPPTARIFHHKHKWGESWHYAACGNDDCKVSSGIHGGPTFGRGELDYYGYWEIPCAICARDRERTHPEDGECWPFKPCNSCIQQTSSLNTMTNQSYDGAVSKPTNGPIPNVGERPTKKFVCHYYHDGCDWTLLLDAYDWNDVLTRCAKLGWLILDGEHIMTIPAQLGWLGQAICSIRNFFWRSKP